MREIVRIEEAQNMTTSLKKSYDFFTAFRGFFNLYETDQYQRWRWLQVGAAMPKTGRVRSL